MTVKVSFCVPVFDAELAVGGCLESILEQRIDSAEILVVDNRSNDATLDVARRVLASHARARVVVNERNVGRIGNWNRCLELAQGEYVKFLMVNDRLLKGSVATLLGAAASCSSAPVIVASQHTYEALERMPVPKAIRVFPPAEALAYHLEGGDPFWALNGMLIRRDGVERAGLRFREDLPYMADRMLSVQLARLGDTVFLAAPSYVFNRGAKGRFHYQGLDVERNVRELQSVLAENARLLEEIGVSKRPPVHARLWRAYLYYLYDERARVSYSAAWRIFEGSRRHQLLAVAERVACALGVRSRLASLRRGLRPVTHALGLSRKGHDPAGPYS